MPYKITSLSNRLIFIRWEGSPSAEEGIEFINALYHYLNEASAPVYFISDLRKGCITNAATVYKLVRLAAHPKWAGSVAFSGSKGITVFANLFSRLTRPSQKEMWPTSEAAIACLEAIHPGLTAGIDWSDVLDESLESNAQRL